MGKRKVIGAVLLALVAALFLACAAFFTACGGTVPGGGQDSGQGETEWTLGTVYAQAQALGYEGSLEDFIALISGRDGQDGEDGQDGVGVKDMYVNEDGNLIVVLSNDAEIDCGRVVGQDGQDGQDGAAGQDGVGVKDMYVNENGDLIVVLSNDEEINCGHVRGESGQDGADGEDGQPGSDGQDGVGIKEMYVNEDGDLIAVLTSGEEINCGHVRGEDGQDGQDGQDGETGQPGADGEDGEDGQPGAGIQEMYINEAGHLIVVLTDGKVLDCGAVREETIAAESISLDQAEITLEPGETAKLTATVLPEEVTDKTVAWNSTNEGVAIVHDDGTVEAVSRGTAVIVAVTTNNKFALCTVTVVEPGDEYIEVTGVSLDRDSMEMTAGDTAQLTATVQPENATEAWVEWSSSAPSVVAVREDGTLYALSAGAATITARTVNGKTAACTVTVADDPQMADFIYAYTYDEFGGGFGCTILGVQPASVSKTELVIPDCVTSIAGGAFKNCLALTSLTTPIAEQNLGYYFGVDFADGNNVALPANLTEVVFTGDFVGEGAFRNCISLRTFRAEDGLIDMGSQAFSGCISLDSVTLPSSLRYISNDAFYGCISLTEIALPEGLEVIAENAFNGCISLRGINIPASVTRIDSLAFYGCISLESVSFAGGPESIAAGVFENCPNLKKVSVNDLVKWSAVNFESPEANPLYITKDLYVGDELVRDLVIPGDVHLVGQYAFSGSSIVSVTFESGVVAVNSGAFYACADLVSVAVSGTIEGIGEGAFAACSKLSKVSVDDLAMWSQINFVSPEANPLYFAHDLYVDGNIVRNLVIPGEVFSVGQYAFHGSSIANVTIESGVRSIRRGAFTGCPSLTSVTIPNSVTSIGEGAFAGCTAMNNIIFADGSRLASIGNSAFSGCSALASVAIPSGVTSIGDSAFSDCSQLADITIPSNVTSIGNSAFSGCSILTSVNFGENSRLASMGEYVFRDCSALESIALPNGLTSISAGMFYNCTALEEVELPAGIMVIRSMAFMNCTALTNIVIPGGVTSIEEAAFSGCRHLTSIEIPVSVTSIGSYVFQNCLSLSSVTFAEGSRLTNIENNAFENCDLRSIALPGGLTQLSEGLFRNCGALESVDFGENSRITSIGNGAFDGCGNLSGIVFPSGLLEIGDNAFNGCSDLTDVTLPDGLLSIGSRAFFDNNNINILTIPGSVVRIGDDILGSNNPLRPSSIIYCEAEKKPSGWSDGWFGGRVIWNCNESDVGSDGRIYTDVDGILYAIKNGEASVVRPTDDVNTSVVIPESIVYREETYNVTSIDSSAFIESWWLESVVISEGITYIGDQSFWMCASLEFVVLPKSLTEVGMYPFDSCNIYYNGSEEDLQNVENYTCLGGKLYYYSADEPVEEGNWWRYLEDVPTPWEWGDFKIFHFETNGGSEIADIRATALTELPTPTKEGHIFGGWFDNAELSGDMILTPYYDAEKTTLYAKWIDISTIEQSEGLEIVGGYIVGIGTCTDEVLLLNLPIAERAFMDCDTITKVIIGTGVTSIGDQAFGDSGIGCDNLTEVIFLSPVPTGIGSDIFGSTWNHEKDFDVYVPQGSLEAYLAVEDSYWQEYLVNTGKIHEITGEIII